MAINGKSGRKLINQLFRRERWVKTNVRPEHKNDALDTYDKMYQNEEKLDQSNGIERLMRKVNRRLQRAFSMSPEAHKPFMSTRQKVTVTQDGAAIELTMANSSIIEYEGILPGDIVVFLNGSLKGQNLAVVSVPDSSHLILEDATLSGGSPAVAAHYTGTPAGASTPVTITANTAGAAGNVTLTFDGSTDISDTISNWNTAHPTNQLTLTSGVGTQIPSAGTISLTGGADAVVASESNITIRINLAGAKRSFY